MKSRSPISSAPVRIRSRGTKKDRTSRHAEDDREDEQPLDRQQPQPVLPQDEKRDRRQDPVDQDEIDDDLGAQAHAGQLQCASSPYFSNRR